MRSLFRLLAPVLAATAIALTGGISAVAAASPSSTSLDASWCYTTGATEYCYEIDGAIQYLDTRAGSSVMIHQITRTTVYESGQFAGEAKSVTMSRSVFEDDGTVVIQTVTNTKSNVGGEPCTYRLVLRLVDYEAAVVHTTSTCEA